MKEIKWSSGYLTTEPIKKNKKITGTHFPTIVGANPFSTPFEVWCRCTRTYEKPFEGNKYTNAGQVIEPKVFEFLRKSVGLGDKLVTPEDVYGKDHFKKTWGDFYPDTEIFGGMWDALVKDENGNIEFVVEIKTVQVDGRSGNLDQRWKDGQAPDYQSLQASLYAYLLGVDKVLMVAVALEDSNGDYEHPELVVPSYANHNVYIDEFKVSERYPQFDMYIEKATKWWNDHVITGVSPEYDEKKDAEILKALRTNNVEVETDIAKLIEEAEVLRDKIDAVAESLVESEKRLKNITEKIKQFALAQFRDGDNKVSIKGKSYEFTLSKTNSTEIDKEQLAVDGLLEKYTKQKTSLRLTTSKIKEDK